MPSNSLFTKALIGWAVAVLLALIIRTTLVIPGLSTAEYVGWMFLGCAPVAVVMMLVRGRSARSIAQVLYDAEQGGADKPAKPTAAIRG